MKDFLKRKRKLKHVTKASRTEDEVFFPFRKQSTARALGNQKPWCHKKRLNISFIDA